MYEFGKSNMFLKSAKGRQDATGGEGHFLLPPPLSALKPHKCLALPTRQYTCAPSRSPVPLLSHLCLCLLTCTPTFSCAPCPLPCVRILSPVHLSSHLCPIFLCPILLPLPQSVWLFCSFMKGEALGIQVSSSQFI